MGRNEADVVRSTRPLGVKNSDILFELANNDVMNEKYLKNHEIKVSFLKTLVGVGSFYE